MTHAQEEVSERACRAKPQEMHLCAPGSVGKVPGAGRVECAHGAKLRARCSSLPTAQRRRRFSLGVPPRTPQRTLSVHSHANLRLTNLTHRTTSCPLCTCIVACLVAVLVLVAKFAVAV